MLGVGTLHRAMPRTISPEEEAINLARQPYTGPVRTAGPAGHTRDYEVSLLDVNLATYKLSVHKNEATRKI